MQRVITPRGMGYLWDGTPLAVQIERQRVGIVLDSWQGPMRYFLPEEIEVWTTTRYPLLSEKTLVAASPLGKPSFV